MGNQDKELNPSLMEPKTPLTDIEVKVWRHYLPTGALLCNWQQMHVLLENCSHLPPFCTVQMKRSKQVCVSTDVAFL